MNITYLTSFGLGVIAGMRSFVAPAPLSRKLVRTVPSKEPQEPIDYLAHPTTELALTSLAALEILGDKIPNVPDRTVAPEFGFRVVSGAGCGAAVSQVTGGSVPVGAILGGLGATVGTLAFFHLRQWLNSEVSVPDPLVALAEDALAIGVGWSLVNGIKPTSEPVRAEP